jgi:23S rRNA (cytidine1920-2'-O)/16S rRNA (cytidine1409-2'-O)-methyltransferase
MRERLDKLLVDRGYAESREGARRLVMAGAVQVAGRTVDKPGTAIDAAATIEVRSSEPRFASRGGIKLDAALTHFGVSLEGAAVLDVGASTGGFTDCALQRGARTVYAVDVGYGQLDWKLRNDPRVVVLERTNARFLAAERLPGMPSVAVVDVSFISLRLVLPAVLACLEPGGTIVALVKPQFEVGKGRVGKGGVVRDPKLHEEVVAAIRSFGVGIGLADLGYCESPIQGPKGNREFFVALRKPRDPADRIS